MTFISRCRKSLALENMAQVPATSRTCNLSSSSIWVRSAIYCTRETLIESWPAAAGIKLGGGLVKRCPTSSTVINTFSKELVVLPCASQSAQKSNLILACNILQIYQSLTKTIFFFFTEYNLRKSYPNISRVLACLREEKHG